MPLSASQCMGLFYLQNYKYNNYNFLILKSIIAGVIKISLIEVVIGGIIGSILTLGGAYLLQYRNEMKQIKAMRTLLKVEIRGKLKSIEKIYDKLLEEEIVYQDPDIILAERLVELDVINWEHDIWRNKSPSMTIALKEDEINGIEQFYYVLDEIISIHLELQSLMKHEINFKKSNQNANLLSPNGFVFSLYGKDKWNEFDKNVKRLQNCGNKLLSELESVNMFKWMIFNQIYKNS